MLSFILAALLLGGAARPSAPQGRQTPYLKDRADRPIPRAIVAEFIDDKALRAAGGSSERAAVEVARSLFATPIDLDGDRARDWVVQYDCAVVGNCATSVYRATRDGFRRLLETDNAHTVSTRRSSSKGLRDLQTSTHGSAFDGELAVYRFDGKAYRRVACMFYSYRYLDGRGRMRARKRPEITRVHCEGEER